VLMSLHKRARTTPAIRQETSRSYLFVAIDRATCWVFVQIKKDVCRCGIGDFSLKLFKSYLSLVWPTLAEWTTLFGRNPTIWRRFRGIRWRFSGLSWWKIG